MGKSHKLQENEAILKESFLSCKTKYICSVSKHGLHKPCICPNCYTCVERIDIHLHHFHQINKGSTEIQKKKKKKSKTQKNLLDILKPIFPIFTRILTMIQAREKNLRKMNTRKKQALSNQHKHQNL